MSVLIEPTVTFSYITTESEFWQAISEIKKYRDEFPGEVMAVDIETYFNRRYGMTSRLDGGKRTKRAPIPQPILLPNGEYDGYVRIISVGLNPRYRDRQFVFDTDALPKTLITEGLKDILENAVVIGHNLKYDYSFLLVQYGIDLKTMRCTKLFWQSLNAGDNFKKGSNKLSDLYRDLIDYGYFKDVTGMTFNEYEEFKTKHQRTNWAGDLNPSDIKYAAEDVQLVHEVYEHQIILLDKFHEKYERKRDPDKCLSTNYITECENIPSYALPEIRGVPFNSKRHTEFVIPLLKQKKKEAENELAKYFTKVVKMASGRGKKRKVWEETVPLLPRSPYMLNEVRKLIPKLMDMEAESLKLYVNDHPSIKWFLQYKKASHLEENFGQKLVDVCYPDGRLHPNINQIGTITGRNSMSDPSLQNIPARELLDWILPGYPNGIYCLELFRESFGIDNNSDLDDYVMAGYDYSQFEPRIACVLYKEENLIKEFNRGKEADIYAMTARDLLELEESPKTKEDWAKLPFDRTATKVYFLGKLYRMGAPAAADHVKAETSGSVDWKDEKKFGPNYPQLMSDRYDAAFPCLTAGAKYYEEAVGEKAESFESLAQFKAINNPRSPQRTPYFIAHNKVGRIEGFYLTKGQEDAEDWKLGKWVKKKRKKKQINPETNEIEEVWYETFYNDFKEALNHAGRESFNFTIQSLQADALKLAVLKMHKEFIKAGFDIIKEGLLLFVHDEVLGIFRKDHIDQALEIMMRCMIEAGSALLDGVVPILVEGGQGRSWVECKK